MRKDEKLRENSKNALLRVTTNLARVQDEYPLGARRTLVLRESYVYLHYGQA